MLKQWQSIRFQDNLASGIPALPGVYAIVLVHRIHALPIQLEMVYASKALNLRQRFQMHVAPWRRRNRLRLSGPDWEFWFRKMPLGQLDRVERDIIRHAEPPGNQLEYRTPKDRNERGKENEQSRNRAQRVS